jgi:hypothetical protein
MALFTTALGLYGGVLWSGELQGFIIHQMMPSAVRGNCPRCGVVAPAGGCVPKYFTGPGSATESPPLLQTALRFALLDLPGAARKEPGGPLPLAAGSRLVPLELRGCTRSY